MRPLCLLLPLLLLASACDKKNPPPAAVEPPPLKPVPAAPAPQPIAPTTPRMPIGKCAMQEEADALNMRVLQSDLMVAGLSCQLHGDYADFVKSQKKALSDNSVVMKRYFTRTGSGMAGMDRFVTSLANDSSKQSLNTKSALFCGQGRALFKELKALSSTQLAAKLNNTPYIAVRRNIPLCPRATADVNREGPQPTTKLKDALKK